MVLVQRGMRSPTRQTAVTLTPVSGGLAPLTVEMMGAATIDGANPTWDEHAPPHRQATLEWTGVGVVRQTFTAIFQGGIDGNEFADITDETSKLHLLAVPKGSRTAPPVLRISGPLYGVGPDDRWRIEKIGPGTPQRRESDGRVYANTYEVTLAQYLSQDIVTFANAPSPAAAAAARQGATAPAAARTYTVRAGDSLSRVAASQLGAAGRWPELAKLNNIRDPNSIRVGQVLRLP